MSHVMMQLFQYTHLKPEMQVISKPFGELAQLMDKVLPNNIQKDRLFEKLVEAKDCAVRASFFKEPQ